MVVRVYWRSYLQRQYLCTFLSHASFSCQACLSREREACKRKEHKWREAIDWWHIEKPAGEGGADSLAHKAQQVGESPCKFNRLSATLCIILVHLAAVSEWLA